MASRERKRADRHKRKARGVERRSELSARSEARNEAVRAELEPLEMDERPTVVTVGAVISALISLSVIVAFVAGAEVDGEKPPLAQVIAPAALMGIMAWGMWKARYWAVLGFQVVLLIVLLAASLGLLGAAEPLKAIGNFILLTGAGTLFYLMIKAMARIQMPTPRSMRE